MTGTWQDAELLVMEALEGLTVHEVVTDTPGDLQQQVPLIRVRRLGGGDNRLADQARIVVEVYAATRAQAVAVAEQARARFGQRKIRTPSGLIDRVDSEVGPNRLPYDDPDIRLVQAIYRVTARRWRTA